MPLPCHILSIAPNGGLRTIRDGILQDAGYVVTSLPSTYDALRVLNGTGYAFDIVIVCDCVPAEERSRFIATVKAASPSTPMLLIGKEREPLTDDFAHDEPQNILDRVAGSVAA